MTECDQTAMTGDAGWATARRDTRALVVHQDDRPALYTGEVDAVPGRTGRP